jgi:hypothetical protein
LDVAAGDQDRERQSAGVHGDVPFAAVDLLPRVVAAAGAADSLRGAYRLGVDQRGRRLPVTFLDLLTYLLSQAVVHAVQRSVGGPGLEVVVDELVVGKIGR